MAPTTASRASDPSSFKPVVVIGHTKELTDFQGIEYLLSYLERKGIALSTFEETYGRCN